MRRALELLALPIVVPLACVAALAVVAAVIVGLAVALLVGDETVPLPTRTPRT